MAHLHSLITSSRIKRVSLTTRILFVEFAVRTLKDWSDLRTIVRSPLRFHDTDGIIRSDELLDQERNQIVIVRDIHCGFLATLFKSRQSVGFLEQLLEIVIHSISLCSPMRCMVSIRSYSFYTSLTLLVSLLFNRT